MEFQFFKSVTDAKFAPSEVTLLMLGMSLRLSTRLKTFIFTFKNIPYTFKTFLTFKNIHLLCYRETIHNLISKICPKFQVISSHFFKVDELLNEH